MTYRIGIDAGSKTLKLVVLDEAGTVVYDAYMRHRANIARTLGEAIHDLNWRHGPVDASIAMTGSAAIEVARVLGIPFVQEVVATTHAVRTLEPNADVVIELGGEDAKIIYLDERPEQRMNATCAGGTGGFIDTIAYMLDMRSSQMSQLAFGASRSYPIASRCAVFAQTDVRPLLNAGASKADIAASVFDAVVRQTLSGLACGRPIRGNVVFLGGPLEHMPYLVHAFRRTLGLSARDGVKPKNAHLFTVTGAALLSDDARRLGCDPVVMNTAELERRVASMGELESDLAFLPPLFEDADELAAFRARHGQAEFERQSIYEATGPLFLGIDAGSTTLKLVALNTDAQIVYSVMLPRTGCEADRMSEAWETVPSESACYPAKTSHVRYFSLCEGGCDAVFMPRFTRNYHCPVQTGYASALAANVGTARSGAGLAPIVSPELANYRPARFVRDEASMERLLAAVNELAGDEVPAITRDELDRAFSTAVQRQEEVGAELARQTEDALRWLADDPSRHGIVLAGRPYHMDEALLHGIDRELAQLGFAVLGVAGLAAVDSSRANAHLQGPHPWMPAKRLVGIARFVADHPQLDAVFLQSFGCGFEAVSIEEAADVLDAAGKPCTTLKVDDISDLAHIRIRLRTLAAAIAMRGEVEDGKTAEGSAAERFRQECPAVPGKTASLLADIAKRPLDADDLECARRSCVKDACFTANAMAARVIRMLRDDPGITRVELPRVCETCLTDAVPRIVERACGRTPEYAWVPWASGGDSSALARASMHNDGSARPRIGIVGNPLIVFEPFMNDHVVEMLESLGCEPIMPDPALLTGDDVRYLDQLALFDEQGIHDVIYLLSFGCLKGHVSARGALRELHERFADMRITVIDYDPESSALNRENRIRLAVDAAR